MTEISISSFDSASECEAGRPMMLKHPNGADTGVTLIVLGAQADAVKRDAERVINKSRREDAEKLAEAKKKGKVFVDEIDIAEQLEENITSSIARVVGWSGVTEEFSPALLRKVLRRNSHWCGQIIDFSGDLGNFTNLPDSDSSDTPDES